MKKKKTSIDGFIPRRQGEKLGDLHQDTSKDVLLDSTENRLLHTTGSNVVRPLGEMQSGRGLGRADIDESLHDIDDIKEPVKKLTRRQKRKLGKQLKRPKSLARRITKWFFIILLLVGIGFGGYTIYRVMTAGENILQGSLLDIFRSTPLKEDVNGRSNFLILGTSEDDEGHQASYLTDSIMVLSVDQDNKNAYMFNVPRDLQVHYGMPCISGFSGKINEYFSCINDGTSKEAEQDRLNKTQAFIGDIFGIDIQYGVHVNYTVMRDVVKALGGSITVTIESRDPRGQMDANFDWKCGAYYYERIQNCPPNGHFIDYPNGPVTIDAEHALYLAQARGDIANYGFELSNFDREKNQQKIIVAMRDKAMSMGTLTNLGSVTGLIDALGDNLRTNIQASEINTLMQVAGAVKNEDIHSLDLFENGVMQGDGNPAAGVYEYDDIRNFIEKNLNSDPIVRENASIVVLNGTVQAGLGQAEADKLAESNFNITLIDNAPSGDYIKNEIYQIGDSNNQTANKLSNIYGVEVLKTDPPTVVDIDVDFVVIIGVASTN